MAATHAVIVVATVLWLQTETAVACTPVTARKGTRLLLQCNVCQPPPSTGTRWYNISGGAKEEISAGIQPNSGALLLTQFVQDPAFGGQKYGCQCGPGASECYVIYVPPQIFIDVNPPNAIVGSEVSITCRADLGYPPVSELDLHHVYGGTSLLNGVPHTIRNVAVVDGGEYTCSVSAGPLQESCSTHLNVYHKPSIQRTSNHTVSINPLTAQTSTESATLECTIFNNKSLVMMKWCKDGKEILIDGIKYVQPPLVSETSTTYTGFLIVRRLTASDLGSYECKLFTNYTHMVVEDVQTLYIHPMAAAVPPTEDTVSTLMYIVIMAAIISILIPAVLILGVVTCVLCCLKRRTGACDISSKRCPSADVNGDVWQNIGNPEEIGGSELLKDQSADSAVPSNPSPPGAISVHATVRTSTSTGTYSANPCLTHTNSSSNGSSSQSKPRKQSRKRSDFAEEQGEVLLNEFKGDDDVFNNQ